VSDIGRVLLVDDEASMLAVCERVLRSAGFQVETAGDGAIAVERMAEGFDVIVSDIHMPGMDGFQLLRRVRERDLDVPVILMTGAPSIESAVCALDSRALRYLIKPFSMHEFVEKVAEACRLRRFARAQREAMELLGAEAKLVGDPP
jgi:DNA-binding NtrC family response regulator